MSYSIKIKKQAKKVLDKAPEHIREKFDAELKKVQTNPRANKALQGLSDTYRIKAGGYRLIYEVDDSEVTVTVVKVGPRGDVYKG